MSKNTRKYLEQKVRKEFERVNKLYFKNLEHEKESGFSTAFFDTQFNKISALTESGFYKSGKIKTGSLSKMSVQRLKSLHRVLKSTLESSYATPEGRQEIYQRQKKTFMSHHPNVTEDTYKTFTQVISKNKDLLETLRQARNFSSEQTIEMISRSNANESEITDVLNLASRYLRFNENMSGLAVTDLIVDMLNSDEVYESIEEKVRLLEG